MLEKVRFLLLGSLQVLQKLTGDVVQGLSSVDEGFLFDGELVGEFIVNSTVLGGRRQYFLLINVFMARKCTLAKNTGFFLKAYEVVCLMLEKYIDLFF